MPIKPGDNVPIRAYSKGQLANMYHVDVRTLNSWITHNRRLAALDIVGRIFTPKQVGIIFEELGMPG